MVTPAAGQKTKSGAQAKAKNGPMPERYPNSAIMDQQKYPRATNRCWAG